MDTLDLRYWLCRDGVYRAMHARDAEEYRRVHRTKLLGDTSITFIDPFQSRESAAAEEKLRRREVITPSAQAQDSNPIR